MPKQIYDRNGLFAMLRYQFEIGVDEALLDFPDPLASPVKLSELLSPKNTTVDLSTKLPAGPIIGSVMEMVPKLAPSKNGRRAVAPAAAARQSVQDNLDLSKITSLADLRTCLAALDDCPLKHTASNFCFAGGLSGGPLPHGLLLQPHVPRAHVALVPRWDSDVKFNCVGGYEF